ncbi:hypothetical protein Tco_1293504, partial [Tanacetum coccineum]
IMEMEPDIENMMLNEFLEYEAEKARRLWDNLESKSSPTTRMGQEKVQHGCNVDTSRDTNHESSNLLNFPIFAATNEFSSICKQDVDLETEEAEVEDDDDGDSYDIWDITVEEVERIRQFLMPNVPDEMDEATKSILDELLEEFNDEIVNVTMVNEEVAKDPLSHFTEIQDEVLVYLTKLRGSIPNWASWMLYRLLVKLLVMLDVARGSRL